MASIRLGRYEVEHEHLPQVCIRCGAPATVRRKKQFSWYPPWVWAIIVVALLPGAIVAMVLTKKMKMKAPLCDQHKNHWRWRALVTVGGLIALLGLGAAIMPFMDQLNRDDTLGFVCLGWVGVLLVWLVVVAVVQLTAVRPTEITDHSMTLTGVADGFVEAMAAERRMAKPEEVEPYDLPPRAARRPSASEEFYDPGAG
jgi:tetrahydromethanopterin S-methyltransferase subunit C